MGSQDQVSAAYGGLNTITFLKDGAIRVAPVAIDTERKRLLNDYLMLFYTGHARIADTISASYSKGLDTQKDKLFRMLEIIEEALEIMGGEGDLSQLGELLDESWSLKRSLSASVSTENIDAYYAAAKSAGALGGKLTGAGGGGMLLLFVPPEKQSRVRETLRHLLYIPFQFESNGSQIIFSDAKT